MKQLMREYELFTKLLIVVLAALCLQAVIVSMFIYHHSKKSYIDYFDQSNAVSLKKIQHDFEMLNDKIENTLAQIDRNPAVEDYFTDALQHIAQQTDQLIAIQRMNESFNGISPTIDYDLMIFGENGRLFVGNDMIAAMTATDFFQLDLLKKVNATSASTQMVFVPFGLTTREKHSPSVFFIKKLTTSMNRTYGYGVIAVTSHQLAGLFNDIVDPTLVQIDFVNEDQQIFTSNDPSKIGAFSEDLALLAENETKMIEENKRTRLALYRQNSALISKVDLASLVNQMAIVLPIILYNVVTLLFAGFFVFIYLNRHTKSIYQLIHSLKGVKEDPKNAQIPVQGTHEIKLLGNTLNQLLTDLDWYYTESLQNEKKKRTLEIQAMQAQIQPHFMYNTLTSLKFLIWQQENEKAIQGIDRFTDLLRHTIGHKKEEISVEEELKNVENYLHILTLRYGETIPAKVVVPTELYSLYLPNMIIQPIVENAYLHAFQTKTKGFITIYGRISKHDLLFEVVDNGDGFDPTKTGSRTNTFSGIGISHVDERIRLMYGEDYGLSIQSLVGIGTTVTIRLPLISK